jgi:hypothetical protein
VHIIGSNLDHHNIKVGQALFSLYAQIHFGKMKRKTFWVDMGPSLEALQVAGQNEEIQTFVQTGHDFSTDLTNKDQRDIHFIITYGLSQTV